MLLEFVRLPQPDMRKSCFAGVAGCRALHRKETVMFKRILVPVDGSSASTAGLEQALEFARDQKAKLRIIHIVDETVLAEYPEMIGDTAQLIETMISDGKKTLAKALKVAQQ